MLSNACSGCLHIYLCTPIFPSSLLFLPVIPVWTVGLSCCAFDTALYDVLCVLKRKTILCIRGYYEKNLQRLVCVRFIIFAGVDSDCVTFAWHVPTDTPTILRRCHILLDMCLPILPQFYAVAIFSSIYIRKDDKMCNSCAALTLNCLKSFWS